MSLSRLFRLAYSGLVLAREGALALIDPAMLPPGPALLVRMARLIERRSSLERSERLNAALARLGPSYVKFGQFLATRPDIVGIEAAASLGRLRDEMPPFADGEARAVIAAALGRPVEALFSQFSTALAAASIAQVHRAEISDGAGGKRYVAVKILRPGVRQRFQRDLDTFYAGAHLAEFWDRRSHRLKPVAVVDTLARSVTLEMDLRLEAAALSEMGEASRRGIGLRVPRVEWERTARDVLTMEWVEGTKMSNLAALKAAGHDLPLLARKLMQSFLRQALREGFFHADLHQGNLFVDAAGEIVAVDFGIMGRLGKKERRFLAEILYGFITRDYRRIAEVHLEAGYVPGHHPLEDFAQALRAIGEPIHDRPARSISMARLLQHLFEVTGLFDMETRPELLLLQKTMVVVEGVCRSLDEDFDMWSTSEPVVRDWMKRNLGAAGKLQDAADGFLALSRLLSQMPLLAERAERLSLDLAQMGGRGMKPDPETVEKIGTAEARASRFGRLALWIIALSVAWLAMRLP